MRGILTGALALIFLQVLVSHSNASGAVGGIATGIGGFVNGFIDPNTPAIPDLSQATTSSATTTTPATSSPSSAGTNVGPPPGNTGSSGFLPGEV